MSFRSSSLTQSSFLSTVSQHPFHWCSQHFCFCIFPSPLSPNRCWRLLPSTSQPTLFYSFAVFQCAHSQWRQSYSQTIGSVWEADWRSLWKCWRAQRLRFTPEQCLRSCDSLPFRRQMHWGTMDWCRPDKWGFPVCRRVMAEGRWVRWGRRGVPGPEAALRSYQVFQVLIARME